MAVETNWWDSVASEAQHRVVRAINTGQAVDKDDLLLSFLGENLRAQRRTHDAITDLSKAIDARLPRATPYSKNSGGDGPSGNGTPPSVGGGSAEDGTVKRWPPIDGKMAAKGGGIVGLITAVFGVIWWLVEHWPTTPGG